MPFSTQPLIVIPTYNERDNIVPLVEQLLTLAPPVHILIVDDSSPDGTAAVVCRVYASRPSVTILSRPRKEGLGPAYKAGFLWGIQRGFDYLVQMDGDLSHDPADVPRLLAAAQDADLVLGSRYVRGGSIRNWSRSRRLLSRGGNLFARRMLGLPIRDLTGGFKCWRREALEVINSSTTTSNGYAFQIETTWRACQVGLHIAEVPIQFTERRAGSSKMCRSIIHEAAHLVLRLRLEGMTRPNAYPSAAL